MANRRRRKKRGVSSFPIIAALALIAMIVVVIVAVAINSNRNPELPSTGATGTFETETGGPTSDPTGDPTSDPTTDPTGDPTTDIPSTSVITKPTSGTSSVILGETADAGQEYLEKMVFLGDSTTYHMLVYGPFADGNHNTNVWAGVSHTLTLAYVNLDETKITYYDTNEELTIAQAAAKKQPEILVITLGINGVLYMQENYFKGVYTELINNIRAVSPNTKIILNSMFPVLESYSNGTLTPDAYIPMSKVNQGNIWILEMAEDLGCYYLNSQEAIADENGYLPEKLSLMDGVHLNGEAYEKFFNYVRTHAIPEYVK